MSQQVQFKFAHGTLESKQQSIIHQARIIDTVRVHEHCPHHAAELNQVVPVAAVAGQSRRFNAEDPADFATADLGDEALKSRTLD